MQKENKPQFWNGNGKISSRLNIKLLKLKELNAFR